MGPLTGRQVLGSKSGQVMLETDEMNWPCIFMQLKKVQLFRGSLFMSPGCGAEKGLWEAWQESHPERQLETPGSSPNTLPSAAHRPGATRPAAPRSGPGTTSL